MKTDVNGCSTTAAGQEQYEEFFDNLSRTWKVQYDYRTPEGKLFSCVTSTIERARARRDAWLVRQSAQQSVQSDGANEIEHTGIPETCKHPDCVRLFQSPRS